MDFGWGYMNPWIIITKSSIKLAANHKAIIYSEKVQKHKSNRNFVADIHANKHRPLRNQTG
jgi:hypothetical protein